MSDKAEQKHTPLPWEVCNLTDIFSDAGVANAAGKEADENDGWLIADCSIANSTFAGEDGLTELSADEQKANAAFIIKAANNHYKLVEALKLARQRIEELQYHCPEQPSSDTISQIDKALAEVKS